MDDLISEFITETSESLSTLDLELVRLEQNPNDKEILSNIFRLVHTIKGTCGFLGLPRLETVAHAGENVLGRIRDGEMEVTPGVISIVLEALDAIKAIMEFLAENGSEPEGDDADLIVRLNACAEKGGIPEEAAAPSPPPAKPVKAPEAEEAPKAPDPYNPTMDELEAAWMAAEGPEDTANASEKTEEKQSSPPVPVEASEEAPADEAPLPPQVKREAIKKGLDVHAQREVAPPNMANQSIRVNLDVLENLMSMVGELVLTRNQLMQIVRSKDDNDFKTPLQRLSYITTELQEGIMKTRMQPIGNAWAKFPRLIRDLSLELGKKIELRMEGAETELDRQLLEMIKDPLTHMVRNSCDHGLETPDERRKAGKDETGTVTLSAYHEGGHIIIDISDNGKGVNIARIKEKALQNGMTSSDELAQMADQQIMQFIFRAGFSTAEKVTSVSGRGVGMDVVRTNIEKIGGTVELDSVAGKGSTFHIKIPLTLAIVSVLIVEADGQRFALPQINVQELVRTGAASDYKIEAINESPVLRLRDKLLPVMSLSKALKIGNGKTAKKSQFIVVCKVGATDFGLLVDNIYDTEEIVVKPVSRLLQHIPTYSGNTVLGDGGVIMILDPNGIMRSMSTDLELGHKEDKVARANQGAETHRAPFLLFRSGTGGPKAVPLELVSRLEEIETSDIEDSNGRKVVQYRDDLMVLATVRDQQIPAEGSCEVIVFHYDNKTVGLVVDEILDIVNAEPTVKLTSEDRMFLGTIVMAGKSTDVLDVGYLLSQELDIKLDLESMNLPEDSQDHEILFVDDSMFFRNLTVPFLSAVGYRVTAVSSGQDALYQLSKRNFDMIITDIEMPEMDGFDLAESVRTMSAHRDVPIVAFTSTANEGFEQRLHKAGINDYVLKTEREKLIVVITQMLYPQKEKVE